MLFRKKAIYLSTLALCHCKKKGFDVIAFPKSRLRKQQHIFKTYGLMDAHCLTRRAKSANHMPEDPYQQAFP